MFKRIISLMLVLMLALTIAAVAFAAESEPAEQNDDPITEPVAPVISFDTKTAGWKDFSYVFFHIWSVDDSSFVGYDWGAKKQRGVDSGDGIWSYNLEEKGLTLKPECQYAVIFANNNGAQTYNLLFDTNCCGDVAYADINDIYENPEDSGKTTVPAYWTNQNPAVNGPELKISSIGNVVGTCCPRSSSPAKMLGDFLINTLDNARTFTEQTDQQIIDHVGEGLGLKAEQVEMVIDNTDVTVDWSYDLSTLRKAPVPGSSTEVPYTVDVAQGEGTASGDKDILVINYSVAPEYQYDTVTLTAVPAEGYSFEGWTIEGSYEIEGDGALTDAVLSVKAHDGIKAHARFYINIPVVPGENPRGDADGDGKLTILDATRIQRYLVGLADESEIDKDAADADGDGKITILDATRIQRVIAGLCDIDGDPLVEEPTEGEIPTEIVQLPTDTYELPVIK